MLFIKTKNLYSINATISNYNLTNANVKNEYLNYLKESVEPKRLRKFINNNFVPTSLLSNNDTGIATIALMKEVGYEFLFNSLFDKTRVNFDDCPVTDNFKNKFNTNLTDFFHLYSAEDYNINCSLNMKDNSFTIEIYGIEGYSENLEPNYWNTYNFSYTLDNNGNIDDITKID